MQVNPTMLSKDIWLTQLDESRNRVLNAAESGRLDLSALDESANAESLLAIALEPVPADPLTHVRDAHTQARTYLAQFASASIPKRVRTGLGYTMTPRKALRRVLDHALDHLDQIEQWLTWQRTGTVPVASDGWVGSAVTLNDDTAPLDAQELEAWLWRVDVAVHLLLRRAAQLSRDELDWQPPDGAWTLRHVMHHVASGAVLYCLWFENALPDEPVERYREANRRLIAALERRSQPRRSPELRSSMTTSDFSLLTASSPKCLNWNNETQSARTVQQIDSEAAPFMMVKGVKSCR